MVLDRVEVWRWSVQPPGPHLAATLHVMEAVRSAVSQARYKAGYGAFPESFHGAGGTDHKHAFWLPEDEDGDGLIDHIVVSCANGMDGRTISCLAAVQSFRLGRRKYRIGPSWMGPRPFSGLFGPASVWTAVTPYITARRRFTKTGKERANEIPDAQILREIGLRRLPRPISIRWEPAGLCGDESVLASKFAFMRSKEDEHPPADAVTSFPQLVFPEPVAGPLAFGYAAHFGMGMLMPVGG